MRKILFLAAHRPNRSPSQRYRFEQYFSLLKEKGYSYDLSYLIDEKDDVVFYQEGNWIKKAGILLKSIRTRWKDCRKFEQYDIIFVQREAIMVGSAFFEKQIKKSGKKFVFDFDDSIWLLDTSAANKSVEWLKRPAKTAEIIALADVVLAGNDYLAQFAHSFNSNVKVIPTTIDTQFHRVLSERRPNDTVCIGWSGSYTTIKHFETLVPVLQQLKEKFKDKVRFMVMGHAAYRCPELNIQSIAWSHEQEVQILNQFDIGIMPLPDDQWAKGKCGLKGLSYMACGVPTVMSAVGVNTHIIQHGENGFLASRPEEWFEILSQLIQSPELRTQIGKKGRETVEQKYSTASQASAFLAAFED